MRADQTQTVEKPFGVVAIFSDKMGRIVASVSDFNRSGYGGFTLLEGQKMRAERALAWEVVRGYCSEMLLDGLEDSDCRKMVRRLVEKGANVTIIPIGHEDAR